MFSKKRAPFNGKLIFAFTTFLQKFLSFFFVTHSFFLVVGEEKKTQKKKQTHSEFCDAEFAQYTITKCWWQSTRVNHYYYISTWWGGTGLAYSPQYMRYIYILAAVQSFSFLIFCDPFIFFLLKKKKNANEESNTFKNFCYAGLQEGALLIFPKYFLAWKATFFLKCFFSVALLIAVCMDEFFFYILEKKEMFCLIFFSKKDHLYWSTQFGLRVVKGHDVEIKPTR